LGARQCAGKPPFAVISANIDRNKMTIPHVTQNIVVVVQLRFPAFIVDDIGKAVEHELLHGPAGVVFQRNQTVLVSSTVAANWCKLANARCSRVRVISAD
jgi:hypothetical protein